MTVPMALFLEKMEQRQKGFGNVITAPLRLSWSQLCNAFNEKVRATEDPDATETWKVLCPPTGSGKTQSLIVYASLLNTSPRFLHPGMIIVTRRIEDADKIAQQINDLTREYTSNDTLSDMAISYHSGKKGRVGMNDLAAHPILVICHKAYTLALDMLNRNAGIEDTWDFFYNFDGRSRKLVVIDEAIDLVEYAETTEEDIEFLLRFGTPIKEQFPFEWRLLQCMQGIFEGIRKRKEQKHTEMILADRPVAQWPSMLEHGLLETCQRVDFTEFKNALRSVRMDQLIMKNDAEENRRLRQKCYDAVSAVDAIFKTFIFYSRNNTKPTFNTARLLVPPELKGGVILDATASCNVVYDLFDGATVIQPPPGTRNYKNVRLHVSYGHKVGTSDMKKNAAALSESLVNHLDETFAEEDGKRKVLVVTHKRVEPLLIQQIPKHFIMSVGHWGAVDGSNDWNDYDTAVIFGLPYKPKRWAASIFMGYQGVQSTMWLHDPSQRSFKAHDDIRRAIDVSQMVADIIQAVNRIRCRQVIDEDGNCPPADIFVMLPSPGEAESLLEGISKEMPGIVITDWDYHHQKQSKRGRKATGRGNWDQSIAAHLRSLNPGDRIAASKVKKELSIKDDAWKDAVTRMRTPGTYLFSELRLQGVIYQMEKQRSFFLKTTS
ncbi:hypothetical protein KP005_11970 [Geomonas nitrogeniifigens]|uniref:Uncharacterized protein n=1 Tax=Geomonas diazotrophica TaxID=2843197 RepID=A0ABX8JFW5_9BACT|nr:hypothetical protein [Geomonas nitrogeniifigens]QWV96097.1 hypothetical protein KP005_11970 [Geomonas nitrogeniifigens]